jgi:hypothetical protein
VSAMATPRRAAEAPSSGAADHRRTTAFGLMTFEALTLAVFSTLHLAGALRIGTGNSDGAGVAEALIGVALASGAWALARWPASGRRVARFAVYFAIAGFVVGLTFTIDSGHAIDLAYHATMLPVLIGTAWLLARRPAPDNL